jgi:glycosyltransferase involved in cell wall biosynthesis
MRIGIAIEETWSFLHEIYDDLAAHHDVSLFERRQFHLPVFNQRISNRMFRRDLQQFMQQNDVVFFEWASGLLAAATHLPKTSGIVTRLHRYELYRWADQIQWDRVDRIILVTEAKRREFLARFPEQADKTVVIHEAVSLERFRPHPRPFRGQICILSHLRPRKRIYDLILTFYELRQQRPDFHLHIGGGAAPGFAEYHAAIHQLVDRLGLREHVTFYDHVTEPEAWYRNIDILISNSYSEGLQVTLLEGMASGCYCLSHDWDGVEELLPREYRFLTSSELIEKILHYAEMPVEAREAHRKRLRSLVAASCDIEVNKVRIRQIIEEVGEAYHPQLARSA